MDDPTYPGGNPDAGTPIDAACPMTNEPGPDDAEDSSGPSSSTGKKARKGSKSKAKGKAKAAARPKEKGQGQAKLPKFTEESSMLVVELYIENKSLLSGKKSLRISATKKRAIWQEITQKVNANSSVMRPWGKVRKRIYDIKKSIRYKYQLSSKHARTTGGGRPVEVEYTPSEERLMSVMSPASIRGLGGPDTSAEPEDHADDIDEDREDDDDEDEQDDDNAAGSQKRRPSSQPQTIPPEEDTMQAEVEHEEAYIILESAEEASISNEEIFIPEDVFDLNFYRDIDPSVGHSRPDTPESATAAPQKSLVPIPRRSFSPALARSLSADASTLEGSRGSVSSPRGSNTSTTPSLPVITTAGELATTTSLPLLSIVSTANTLAPARAMSPTTRPIVPSTASSLPLQPVVTVTNTRPRLHIPNITPSRPAAPSFNIADAANSFSQEQKELVTYTRRLCVATEQMMEHQRASLDTQTLIQENMSTLTGAVLCLGAAGERIALALEMSAAGGSKNQTSTVERASSPILPVPATVSPRVVPDHGNAASTQLDQDSGVDTEQTVGVVTTADEHADASTSSDVNVSGRGRRGRRRLGGQAISKRKRN